MQTMTIRVNKVVKPNDYYNWSVTMIAPPEFRIHSSVFKMSSKGEEFGDKCLSEIQVYNPHKPAIVAPPKIGISGHY